MAQTRRPAYLPYVMLGYPTGGKTLDVCRVLLEGGADGLELGLPFRDPVADGPVIQKAGNDALDRGFTVAQGVELVRGIRALSAAAPLTLMAYYNMVIARGAEAFIAPFAEAGMDGLLVPDLPVERAGELASVSAAHGVELVFIASPLSDERRLGLMQQAGGGFLYVVTRLGITGVESRYSESLDALFGRIHGAVTLPAFAGFGISEPEHAARMVAAGADGVIVGSKLVQLIRHADDHDWNLATLAAHTRDMTKTLRGLKTVRDA